MIRGEFRDGRPFVECRIRFPRLELLAEVPFLVDTGSTLTCLHTRDAGRIGIPHQLLEAPGQMFGIGGVSRYFQEPAHLMFDDADRNFSYGYRIAVQIADPAAAASIAVPSLLGWDVLGRWGIDCDRWHGRLRFAVHSADFTAAQ